MVTRILSEFNLTLHRKTTPPELEHAAQFYGIYSRLAKKLGVTPQHVRHVAIGLRSSKRVSAAIDREIRRIKNSACEKAA